MGRRGRFRSRSRSRSRRDYAGLEEASGNNHGAVRRLLRGARDLHHDVGAVSYSHANRGSWDVPWRDVRNGDRLPPI